MGRKAILASSLAAFILVFAAPLPVSSGERVLVISIDGMRADAVRPDIAPFVASLLAEGVHTLCAQSLKPTYTIANHVSMFTGLTPETHGFTMLDDPGDAIVDGTIFEIAHEAGLSTALYISKDKLRLLAKPGTLDRYVVTQTGYCDQVVEALLADIASPGTRYALAAIHLQDLDTIGHRYGWMSPQYVESAARIDRLIEGIFQALERAGALRETVVFVLADHGGIDYDHYQDVPEVKHVPWIAVGPRVPRGKRILTPVRLHDTAPTVLRVLGLPVPPWMEGRTVPEVFPENWPVFRRGDVDADARLRITDAIGILGQLFQGTSVECPAAADADGSLSVNLTDAIYLLNYLALGGPEPPLPFQECGLPEALLPGFPCPAACH